MLKKSPHKNADGKTDAGEIEPMTGQPVEEAEKNLSRHATKDSSPPVDEQWRTSVRVDGAEQSPGNQETTQNKVENDGDKD
ncbi:MAG TPA: hypothetical protein VM095_06615 [Pyrinomonadaceae bacterium]|nr:hypothetical protein [Pyrinomonadaceae bacterium]